MKKVSKTSEKSLPLNLYMIIITASIFLLMSLVVVPLTVQARSDVVLQVTALPEILEIFGQIIDISAFALCYSLIIFACFFYPRKRLSIFLTYIAACFLRRGIDLLITYFTYKWIELLDIESVLFTFFMESIQALVMFLIASTAGAKYQQRRVELKKAAQLLGSQTDVYNIKFEKVFSKSNPLQVIMLFSGIMLSAINVGMRIYYDIIYGAPTSAAEVLIIVLYYCLDLSVCIIFYSMCWFFLSALIDKNDKITEK